jgi:hypothetical protein
MNAFAWAGGGLGGGESGEAVPSVALVARQLDPVGEQEDLDPAVGPDEADQFVVGTVRALLDEIDAVLESGLREHHSLPCAPPNGALLTSFVANRNRVDCSRVIHRM